MSKFNVTTSSSSWDDAQRAAAEVHQANYNSARQRGDTHIAAFRAANDATRRFLLWLAALGAVALLFVFMFRPAPPTNAPAPSAVNWSSRR